MGGNGGTSADAGNSEGGGFGVGARPAGAYVISGGNVSGDPPWTSTVWCARSRGVVITFLIMRTVVDRPPSRTVGVVQDRPLPVLRFRTVP